MRRPRLLRRHRQPEVGPPPPRRGWPWVTAGALLGGLLGLLANLPASWLAHVLEQTTEQRLLLADARGSLWAGSAVAVLTAGPGSRDASALPGRLHWRLGLAPGTVSAFELQLQQACCIALPLRLRLEPGFGRLRISLPAGRTEVGQWPASWLIGLGLPFNAVRPGGSLRLTGEAFAVEAVQGRWRVSGQAELEALGLSSALAPVDTLGSYRIVISGGQAQGSNADAARVTLQTLQGPLRMTGAGQWVGARLHFRGEASADAPNGALLNNLLNLLGQRRGAVAVLAIG